MSATSISPKPKRAARPDGSPASSIAVSTRTITVYIGAIRLATNFLHHEYGVKYNECIMLLTLARSEAPVHINELADYLILEPRTIRASLLHLEDAGLVKKISDPSDCRRALCTLTSEGRGFAEDMGQSLTAFLLNGELTAFLPEAEEAVFDEAARRSNDKLRSSPSRLSAISGKSAFVITEYLILWRTFIDKCTELVAVESDITFNESRILKAIFEYGALSPSELADLLIIMPSGVSTYCNHLVDVGYLQTLQDTDDGRRCVFQCTATGMCALEKAEKSIKQVSCLSHEPFDEANIDLLETWYARLYRNSRTAIRRYMDMDVSILKLTSDSYRISPDE